MVKNARTMFNVVNQFKKVDEPVKENKKENISNNQSISSKEINQPNFFI